MPSACPTIHVAVAVIRYQDLFLLGYRSKAQHQGERFEFVGGKIDTDEPVIDALCREVAEEVGIDITGNHALKLGNIRHDYSDKSVCLHVYQIMLSAEQFERYQHQSHGLENQPLIWAQKEALLSGQFLLPEANKTIVTWLSLPPKIVITLSLAEFTKKDIEQNPLNQNGLKPSENSAKAWLNYHISAIPSNAWVYIRIRAEEGRLAPQLNAQLAKDLLMNRPDIRAMLPAASIKQLSQFDDSQALLSQIAACHLNQNELMAAANNGSKHSLNNSDSLFSNFLIIASCHDQGSIQAANHLANQRLAYDQAPVLAAFLSPVLATKSHPETRPLGWQTWSKLALSANIPVIALGGLSPSDFDTAQKFGATSIAGIRQFLL